MKKNLLLKFLCEAEIRKINEKSFSARLFVPHIILSKIRINLHSFEQKKSDKSQWFNQRHFCWPRHIWLIARISKIRFSGWQKAAFPIRPSFNKKRFLFTAINKTHEIYSVFTQDLNFILFFLNDVLQILESRDRYSDLKSETDIEERRWIQRNNIF